MSNCARFGLVNKCVWSCTVVLFYRSVTQSVQNACTGGTWTLKCTQDNKITNMNHRLWTRHSVLWSCIAQIEEEWAAFYSWVTLSWDAFTDMQFKDMQHGHTTVSKNKSILIIKSLLYKQWKKNWWKKQNK